MKADQKERMEVKEENLRWRRRKRRRRRRIKRRRRGEGTGGDWRGRRNPRDFADIEIHIPRNIIL